MCAGLALIAAPAACVEAGQEVVDEPAATPSTPPLPVATGPLECRFDPVSRPGTEESGFQMCYTPASVPRTSSPTGTAAVAVAVSAALKPQPAPTAAPPTSAEPAASAPRPATSAEPWWKDGLLDPAADPAPCPPEMVLVEGKYCPKLKHECEKYMDGGPKSKAFLGKHRCAIFKKGTKCKVERELRRFCIDRDEYTPEGDTLPLVDQSWNMARELCTSLGKRLCFESEWEFACEGEELRPYPYGWERNSKICNHDQKDLEYRGKLRDLRKPSAELKECVSPFGVRNMVGNVDEWAHRDGGWKPWRASMRGGWWLAGRNNCRAATTGHDEYYYGKQSGFRCCMNAR